MYMATKTMKVRKAVIAAAGFGTRFLPQTKAMPKEMLPLVDKPVIQFVVEELVEAGIEDIIIVTGYHKRSIEDHFDGLSADLIKNLEDGGKQELLDKTRRVSELANFVYVRQKGPYGTGTPLLCSEHLVGDEPFIYTWADDFIKASPNRFTQLIAAYEKYGTSVLAGVRVSSDSDYDRYGFAAGIEVSPGIIDVNKVIEKPGKANAPSNIATNSAYLLTPDIFGYLHTVLATKNDKSELNYNDALKLMLTEGIKIHVAEITDGKYYDAGSKLGYMQTVVDFALDNPEIGADFRKYLESIIKP
jgi:UTP--glucose-1-phosphate uridylyltransferase